MDVVTPRFQAGVNIWVWSLVIASISFHLEMIRPNLTNKVKLARYNSQLQLRFAEV